MGLALDRIWNDISQSPYARHMSGITFIRYTPSQKVGKPNNPKSLEAGNPKRPKQDSQNMLG